MIPQGSAHVGTDGGDDVDGCYDNEGGFCWPRQTDLVASVVSPGPVVGGNGAKTNSSSNMTESAN